MGFVGGVFARLDLWILIGVLKVLHSLQLMHHRMLCGL